jgi:hypothetical protein
MHVLKNGSEYVCFVPGKKTSWNCSGADMLVYLVQAELGFKPGMISKIISCRLEKMLTIEQQRSLYKALRRNGFK